MLNINDIGLINAEDVVGQYHAFGPSPADLINQSCVQSCSSSCSTQADSTDCKSTCAGSCTITCSGCTGQCTGTCKSDCANLCSDQCTTTCEGESDAASCGVTCTSGCSYTCSGTCTLACNGSCQGTCTAGNTGRPSPTPDLITCTVCTSSCLGSCSGDCIGGCGDANCVGQCSLTCQSMCSTGCDNFCQGSCLGYCFESCVNGCKDACTGSCSNGCQGCTGCSGGCISACVDGCKYSCMNVSTADGTGAISPHMPSGGLYPIETVVQTDEMPSPSEELVGKIYQYTGDTNLTFTNGNFYKCVEPDESMYEWRNVTNADMKAMMTDIVAWLNVLSQYKYTRISELPESVIIQDNDTFAANVEYTQEELEDMQLVISNVDNRTVRVSAASLMNYVMHNYQNNWAWTPVVKEDPTTHVMTVIDWEYMFWEQRPSTVNLADLITGGVGRVTDEGDGLMPHEMYTELKNKEVMDISFITGKNRNGETVVGAPLLRFNSQDVGAFNINSAFVDDVMNTFAQAGDFLTKTVADTLYATIRSEQDLFTLLRYVMGPDSLDPTSPADFPQDLITNNIPALYLTKAEASTSYAAASVASTVSSLQTTVGNLQNTVNNFPNTYLTILTATDTFVAKSTATTDIPARVGHSTEQGAPEASNGLMTPTDVDNIASALSSIADITDDIIDIQEAISQFDPSGYASDVKAGIVKIPTTSSIKVNPLDGAIDTKQQSVNNLIRNSIFSEGFGNAWDDTDVDTSVSAVTRDATIDRDIATIAILPDGVYSQEFTSDSRDGFTVGILFKKGASAKTIQVKIDSSQYSSHTIPSGSGYYVAEFYFAANDNTAISDHILYIHNPDDSNTVSYEMSEVMVQSGRKFTGWNRNPYDISGVNSINIVSYDNYLAFKDRPVVYTEDVYDTDGVTILHHAGDLVNPSSSIILHKDQQYLYMHITAVGQIDGQIRQDVIPLRVDLLTGACDISGNAVSAGTLIDNTGELVPTVAELNAFVNGSALDLVDQANEITVTTMPTAAEELVGNIYYYTGETTASFTQYHIYHCVFDDPDYVWEDYTGYQRKYKYSLNKTVNNVVTELASVLHVGRFTGINNAEIFNDYVGNTADTIFSHVEGQGNSALQSATNAHIEGAGNTATESAAYVHIEGSGNIAKNGAAYVHIEGAGNTAENSAAYNHIEGTGHKATGSSSYSHIEGISNTNMQQYDHIEGCNNIGGNYSNHSCGSTMPNGNSLFRSVIVNALPSISNTYNDEMYLVYDLTNRTYTAWDVNWSSGEGVWENNGSISLSSGGAYGHVEGQYNLMGATTGHVEGTRNILKTACSDTHIEGANNIVYEGSNQTHVEGKDHVVYNGVNYSHFEGLNNRSGYTGNGSGFTALHMEGQLNIAASGTNNTHMEGYNNAIQLAGGNTAHIEGYMNRPSQTNYSHIEGYKNSTTGTNYIVHVSGALNTVNGGHIGLHVEGKSNVVPYGKSSIDAATDAITGSDVGGHIEGIGNLLELNPNNSSMTVGGGYHIEGDSNKITYKNHQNTVMNTSNLLADDNHLEGGGNSICGGYRNHIEGDSNWLYGGATHVEGAGNKVYRADQGHVEGAYNNVNSASGTTYTLYYLHVEGYSNNVYGVTNGSHIEGQSNNIYSNNNAYQIHVEGTSHNLGSSTHNVSLQSIHVEGQGNSIDSTVDSLSHSHIEGNGNKVIKIDDIGSQYVNYIHIEGYNNQVNANYSHTEGASNKVYGDGYYNHMEGYNNISHGQYDHTEGLDNHNYGTIGHIEGQYNTIGAYDAVNKRVTNYANHCHVEGIHNLSLGSINHVEGEYNTAYGNYNHIEGYHNESYAHETHTAGSYNINATLNSTVVGQYNEPDNTYDATSIIPSDITITNTSYISTVSGSRGQVVYDGSTTLGVTDYIELPHIPIGFHFAGTNATGGAIAIYDSNKVCLDVIQITETGTVDIDVTPYSQSNMLIHPNWRDAKYIRLCAVMSTSGLNGAQLFLMKEPHLFIVGNGTFNNSVNPSVTVRSNILEVGLNKININGDIYQNGELFKSGTPHFVGTSIEWAALTSEEKAAYEGGDIVFTDDNAGSGIIDQVVTPDSPNPVSGGAVYTAMANMSNPMTSRSTNGYYTGRKYYDGRTTVHYRRKFTSTSLTANAATRVVLGDWDGIDSSFNTLITNAFSNNNNVTYMTIIKDAMDAHICQINCISDSSNEHVAFIACIGTGNYTGEFTIDICIDSY